MNVHDNARLTPKGREEMVRAVLDHGLDKAAAARRFSTTPKTVAKWVARFRAQGVVVARLILKTSFIAKPNFARHSRCRRGFAPPRRTQEHIAAELGISKATVSRILNDAASACSRHSSHSSQDHATNARSPARSFISISKSLAASMRSAIALPVTERAKATREEG